MTVFDGTVCDGTVCDGTTCVICGARVPPPQMTQAVMFALM